MATPLHRRSFLIWPCVAAVSLFAVVGCGGGSEVASQPESPRATPAEPVSAKPEDVVSQFLDRVRRGGDDNSAGELLTRRAQAELRRIGRSVQPIGSPEASFSVTRSEFVPGEPNSVLVHSLWGEPNGAGGIDQYQVVWALERDPQEWRISGLAMEMEEGSLPQILDFENGEMLAKLLVSTESEQGDPPAQASLPAAGMNR